MRPGLAPNSPPDAPESKRRLPRGLSPLGYRDYALYWTGLATTNVGRWVEMTGLVWLVYEMTGSAVLLGLIGLARAVPAFLISPIAGVFADRVDQRRLLFVTQGLGLLASLSLGILIATGEVALWQVYLQVTIQAAIGAFDGASRQTLFPRLVPRTVLPNAVTLSITAGRVSKMIGPVAGGLLIAGLGTAAPFLINAATFLALMGALALMRALPPLAARASSFREDLMEGLHHILGAPVLSGLFKLEIIYGIFDMNPVMIAIIAREVLDVGPSALGFLIAAPAMGSLLGIIWMIFLRPPLRQGRFSLISTMIYAGLLGILAFSQHYLLSLAVLAMIGVFDVLVTVARNSIFQLAAPEGMRGRVMANMGTITRGIGPLAETQSGFLAGTLGVPLAIAAAATALAATAAATAVFNPTLWAFQSSEKSELSADQKADDAPRS